MAHKIIYNDKIKGINIGDVELTISQFADDTSLFLEFCPLVLEEVVRVFTYIQQNLGLKVSYDKNYNL